MIGTRIFALVALVLGFITSTRADVLDMSESNLIALQQTLDTVYAGDEVVDEAEADEAMSKPKPTPKPAPLRFSFPGSGLLGVYTTGVAVRLLELGVLKRHSIMYGTSAGALVSGQICSGADTSASIAGLRSVMAGCVNTTNKCIGTLGAALLNELETVIPKPGRIPYPNCKNTHLTVTVSTGTCNLTEGDFGNSGKTKFFTDFKSKKDLIKSMLASAYIPGFLGFDCYTKARGFKLIDGGFTANLVCPPPGNCVKTYPFPSTPTRPLDIYPGVRGVASLAQWPFNAITWQLASFSVDLVYPNFDVIYQFGRDDAEYWYNQTRAG